MFFTKKVMGGITDENRLLPVRAREIVLLRESRQSSIPDRSIGPGPLFAVADPAPKEAEGW